MENEKKVISAFAIDDGDFVENIINVMEVINNTLKEYDEIDLSEAECAVKAIKRTPTISEMASVVPEGAMIVPNSGEGSYKIYIEKTEGNN